MTPRVLLVFAALFLATLPLVYIELHALSASQQSQLRQEKLMTATLSRQLDIGSTSSYALAKEESFGFFDDIEDATWKRHRNRAQNEALYFEPKQPNHQWTDKAMWLLNNMDPIFTCPNLRRVGGRGDGPKWTCDPHRLVKYSDCLIYSVGSFGNYQFEEGLISLLKENSESREGEDFFPNCEIHVFDPNPNYRREGDPEKNNIHYHPWGLKASDNAIQPISKTFPESFEFLTFEEIQQRLGHEKRRIDILKIDCEGCEYTTYKDWLHPDVFIRQILIETHVLRSQPSLFFDRFFDVGFVLFHKEANTHPTARPGNFFEWGFLRLHPDFLNRSTSLLKQAEMKYYY